jgi:hypothetical protein
MPVFVMSADMSDSFIITGVENLTITSRIGVGDEMTFAGFSEEFVGIPKRSVIVVWEEPYFNGNTDPIVDNVLYVGRMRKETPRNQIQNTDGPVPDTNFTCEGLLAQMNRIRSPQLALSFNGTPTEFQQINGMTQWRIVVFVLSEFSTFLNLCSLRFDDETEDYLNAEDSTEDKSLLASVNGLLSARKSALNIARQGELYAAQSAVFLDTAGRNALDTIHKFTTSDIFRYQSATDPVPTVGSVDVFGGGYNSTDSSLRIIRATAPAVASLEAQGGTKPVNGILLATDATAAEQQTELEQISGNELADANPKDKPGLSLLDGYYFINPTNFQWWGLILTTADNNRGIEYTTNDRFLLESVTIRYENTLNTWDVQATERAETEGIGAKTISQIQPGAIPQSLPDLPSIPAYPSFPAFDDIYFPTGFTNFNLPAIGPNEGAIIITPLPPETLIDAQTEKGAVVAHIDLTSNQLYLSTDFTESNSPTWEVKFTATLPFTIKDFKFDPFNRGAYMLTNNGSGDSVFYRTEDIFVQIPEWVETEFDDIDYTTIRTTATDGEVYIFGIDDRIPPATVNLLNTNTDTDSIGNQLVGSNQTSPHVGSVNEPGIYEEGSWNYFRNVTVAPGGGLSCNVEYPMPARAILNSVQAYFQGGRQTTIGGEREVEISLDGVSIATGFFPVGTYFLPSSPTSGTGTVVLTVSSLTFTGDSVLFHSSMDRETGGSAARISQITMTFSDSGTVQTAFRRSTDYGANFANIKVSGADLTLPATPGYDTGAEDTTVLMAADDVVRGTDDFGENFGGKAGSTTTGTYAKAIKAYGTNANVDTIVATAALFDTTKTVISIENGSQVDITVDDGVNEGIVVSRNALAMSRVSDDDIWGVFNFGGTPKIAYTDDKGSSWTVSAESITPAATYIRTKDTNVSQVYLIDSTVIKYSGNGGAAWVDKTTPSANITLVEVR